MNSNPLLRLSCAAVVLLTGCNQPTSETTVSIDTPRVDVTTVSTKPASPQSSSALEDTQSLEDSPWNDPEIGGSNFFAAPKAAPAKIERKQIDSTSESVRLLGFLNLTPDDPTGNKALLKIGDHIVHLAEGDSVRGVNLLSIGQRSVTLQRDRDRWTLAMFEQPIVNKAQPVQPLRSPSTSQSNSAEAISSIPGFPDIEAPESDPEPDVWMPEAPMVPDELPLGDEQSDIAEIGTFDTDDSGDIEIPGIDDLPGLDEISEL